MGRTGKGGPAPTAGGGRPGEGRGGGVVAVCLPWVRAGSCRPPPLQSLLHLPVSLTHFRERGAAAERGKGWEGDRRRAAASHSLSGKERRCRHSLDSQIESGLTLRKRTGHVVCRHWGGEISGSTLAPPPGAGQLRGYGRLESDSDFGELVDVWLRVAVSSRSLPQGLLATARSRRCACLWSWVLSTACFWPRSVLDS